MPKGIYQRKNKINKQNVTTTVTTTDNDQQGQTTITEGEIKKVYEKPTDRPVLWITVRLKDGKIYKIALERITDIMQKTNPNATYDELCHYPENVIAWAVEHLTWNDVAINAMQTYSSKVSDPAEEWKTAHKGYLCEGDIL